MPEQTTLTTSQVRDIVRREFDSLLSTKLSTVVDTVAKKSWKQQLQNDYIPKSVKRRHIDGVIMTYGLSSKRPVDGGLVGVEAYFSVDTGILSLWDGDSWITFPTIEGNNVFTGSNIFGTAPNYLEITSGGIIRAFGNSTWFDDLRVEPTARGTGTKTPSYANMIGGLYAYEFDNAIVSLEKELNFKMQIPHGWKTASAVHMHLHWVAKSTTSADQKVRWGLEFTKANINGVFGATTTIYATDPANPPSITPTAMTHYLTEFADIDMSGMTLSNFILCRLFRNSSNAADTYTDSAYLIGIDAHVEYDQLGSDQEFIK